MLLVTGASGLLGVNLLLHGRSIGRKAVGLSNHHRLSIPGVQMHRLDLTDQSAVRQIISDLRPTEIIHCAASTNVDWCESHPQETDQINVQASALLAQLAQECEARFVFVSTDSVFDGKQGNYSEADTPSPINVYAQSKLRAEQEVLRANPSAIVMRVTIYGWNAQSKTSLAEWILLELEAGKSVPGFTDVYFSPLLANDLAEIVIAALDHELHGLYHIVGSEKVSKYEFARRVASTFSFDPGEIKAVSMREAKLRAPRPSDISLSTEKIQVALGRPMPDVQTGLNKFLALRKSGYARQLKRYLSGAVA
jgi:dTDP-4-dehydrorhamnose reductase